ncbi:MAG: hypothetical protein DHS20C21_10320 [Gemmatimonadota bacterium]|nr:MAG: hypothetical protein DHS20C21_10320 [Gemmatimonadota bacterium]
MSTLGDVYNMLGEYDESQAILEEALAAWTESGSAEDTEYVIILTNLGKTLEDRGEFDRAQVHLEKALEVARRLLPGSQTLLDTLNNLGVLASYQGDQVRAAELLQESLRERKAAGLDRTQAGATASLNLATLMQHLDNDAKADSLYRAALALYRELIPAGNAGLVMPLAGYGGYLIHVERWEDAREVLEEALAICLSAHGERHPEVAYTRHNLGAALHGAGRLEEAREQYRESCDQWREFLGRHPYLAASLSRQGRLARETGDPVSAERFHREAWDIRREFYGDTGEDTIDSRLEVVTALREQNRVGDAEGILREMAALTDDDGLPFRSILTAQLDFYQEQGNEERADEVRRRVASLPDGT